MKKLSIQSTVTPDNWSPNPTDRQFNNWAKYISGHKATNQIRKGGVCHIDGQESALNQAKQLINTI